MTSAGQLVLHQWVARRWNSANGRVIVRRGLIFSSVWILLCLTLIWCTGSLVESCQRLADSGLTASHNIEFLLAPGGAHRGALDSLLTGYRSQIRGASEELQNRLGLATWLLPTPARVARDVH